MRLPYLRFSGFVVLAFGLIILPGIEGAAAQTTKPAKPPVTDPTPSATTPAAPPAAQAPDSSAFKLAGFRSALFGMDETETRAAIVKDFGVDASAIHKTSNLAEKTEALSVRVPDILKDGGSADVAYVLGYKSKKLIQVNVVWSPSTDKDLTPDRLLANAEALRSYFLTVGYVPATIALNAATHEGILLFRGADADGHTTILLLQGTTTTKDKTNTFNPNALALFYIQDTKSPDVFKISAGKF